MRSYRRFVAYMGDAVLEVLRVMEDEGWHHEGVDSEPAKAYTLTMAMLHELAERAKHYVHEKGGTGEERLQAIKRAAAEDGLDRLNYFGATGRLWPSDSQLEFDDYLRGQAGLNGSEDTD